MYETESSLDRRSDRALRHYLSSIGKYPLVSREEEFSLARRVRGGDKEALDKLINSNLRFVVTVARQFLDRGLCLLDLIAEGNVGLITAARRFDERRDFRFITYAVWWIRQGIQAALQDQTRTVRLPANRVRQSQAFSQAIRSIEQRKMGLARDEEVADLLGLKPFLMARLRSASSANVNLDQPRGAEAPDLSETLVNPDEGSAFEALASESLQSDLGQALAQLTTREQAIIRSYYGFGVSAPMSLEAIAQTYSLSRERVRQIRNLAFAKIRQGQQGNRLVQYLV